MTAGSVVVAHVSDLHIGGHDPRAVDTLVADVAAVAPDLTVVTGDWTMRARTAQFQVARQVLERLPAPRLLVLGNHDVPLDTPDRLLDPYARFRTWIEADLDPWTDVAGLRALGLQTMPRWRWKAGRVSRRQADLVVEVLGSAPPGALRLLAVHHPPLADGPARIVGRDALVDALVAARVDLVLAGHTHVPHSRRVERPGGGWVEVIAGTATSRRTRGSGRSWTVIRVDGGAITVQDRYASDGTWSPGRTVSYARMR